ncbi:hypothetical protein ACFUTY_18195 [Streptomyces sp. NPDC057362]|uniref:hypothetical protein n=1 Tax=Streptomyces sp. NPDC057362 TaxID=3346106 RepID=UPI0036390953
MGRVDGLVVGVPLGVEALQVLGHQVRPLGEQRPPPFGVLGGQHRPDGPAERSRTPGGQERRDPAVGVRRPGLSQRVPQHADVGQPRQPLLDAGPEAVPLQPGGGGPGGQLRQQVGVGRQHGGRDGHGRAGTLRQAHPVGRPAQRLRALHAERLPLRRLQRVPDRRGAAVDVGQTPQDTGEPVRRRGPQVRAQHLCLPRPVEPGQRGEGVGPHAPVLVGGERREETGVPFGVARAPERHEPAGAEVRRGDDLGQDIGVPGQERVAGLGREQCLPTVSTDAGFVQQRHQRRVHGRATGCAAGPGDRAQEVRGPARACHLGRRGPGRGGVHHVVRQQGEPRGGDRPVRVLRGADRPQQVPEPGEDFGRRVSVYDEPSGVGGLGAPPRLPCGDGGDPVVGPGAAPGHHVRPPRGPRIAQHVEDLRSRAVEDILDRTVEGVPRLQRRQADAHR